MPTPRLINFPSRSGTLKHHPLPCEAYMCSETTESLGQSQGISRLPSSDPNKRGRKTTTATTTPPPREPAKRGWEGNKRKQRILSLVCLANVCHSEGEGQPPHQLSHCPGDRSPCALSPGYSLSLTLLVLPSRNLLLDKRQTQQCHTTAKTRKLGAWHRAYGNECPALSSLSTT